MTTVPNPGSPEARRLGCICATMDNAHGKGYRHIEGQPLRFVITDGCAFHWPTDEDFEIIIPSKFGHLTVLVESCGEEGWLAGNDFTDRCGIGDTAGRAIMELLGALDRHEKWLRSLDRAKLGREFLAQLDALDANAAVTE